MFGVVGAESVSRIVRPLMNPFGIFDAVVGVLDIIGLKRRKETRRDRVRFRVLYALLWLLCIAAFILVVRQLYFTP